MVRPVAPAARLAPVEFARTGPVKEDRIGVKEDRIDPPAGPVRAN